MTNLLLFAFSCAFVQNIVLVQFLGLCPFLGVSKNTDSAMGMGLSVILVTTFSTLITWGFYHLILVPLQLEYLQTVTFILIIASLVQMLEMFMEKKLPSLHASLGLYLPLITTNCAVLGTALIAIQKEYDFWTSLVFSLSTSSGFLISIIILSGLRERIEHSNLPKAMRGIPITLITAGLLSLSFFAWSGMVK
jgi:electron transport complex protein RnfA